MKIFYILLVIVGIVLVAGIYKFNFTDSDVYVENKDGQLVPISSEDKE